MWYLLWVSIVTEQCESLDDFVCYLGSLADRPDLGELQERMEGLELTRADLDVYARFDEKNYARNLIIETETVQLLCLCWHRDHGEADSGHVSRPRDPGGGNFGGAEEAEWECEIQAALPRSGAVVCVGLRDHGGLEEFGLPAHDGI